MNLNYAIKFVTIYAQIPLDSSRPTWHHSTRLTCRVYAFWLSSLSNSTARHSRHDELNWFDTQLSLLYNLYKVRICTLFTNLLELYIYLIHVIWGNRICVCKSMKTTTLVQASTKACSSPAMLEQHGSHARLDSLDTSNVSRHDEPSGIWARLRPTYKLKQRSLMKQEVYPVQCVKNVHCTDARDFFCRFVTY